MRLGLLKREHLKEASQLLAKRHRTERQFFLNLPGNYEDEEAALEVLSASFEKPNTYGITAFAENRMAAYLIVHVKPREERGRSVWVDYTDMAYDQAEQAEIIRELYAKAAKEWVQIGCLSHYAFVPLGDPSLLSAWLNLGFAYQQAYAMLDLHEFSGEEQQVNEVVIRRAAAKDRKDLLEASHWISDHQSQSPGFVPILPEVSNEIEKGYEGLVEDEEALVWVAELHGEVVGFQAYWPMNTADKPMEVPNNAIELKVCATKPEYRNMGIGTALTTNLLPKIKNEGFRYCLADWHLLNLQSSRFWPKKGFRPYCYRLHRSINPSIYWANGAYGELLKNKKA